MLVLWCGGLVVVGLVLGLLRVLGIGLGDESLQNLPLLLPRPLYHPLLLHLTQYLHHIICQITLINNLRYKNLIGLHFLKEFILHIRGLPLLWFYKHLYMLLLWLHLL